MSSKKWKFLVTVVDTESGFKTELNYDDLKYALKCFCDFVHMDCDEVQMNDEKGVLLRYAK